MPLYLQICSLLCGLFWLNAYGLILRQARIDRTPGMPLAPLAMNVSYELIFGFIYPDVPPIRYINQVWFAVDLLLVWQYVKYTRENPHPLVPKSWVLPGLLLAVAIAFAGIMAITVEFNDYHGGNYTGWGDQLLISANFIFLVLQRRSSAGQSMYIGLSRIIGTTALIPVQLSMPPHGSVFLLFCYVVFPILDVIYLVLLYRQMRVEGRDPWALRAGKAGAREERALVLAPAQ